MTKIKETIIQTLKEFEQQDYKRGGVSIAPEMYNAIADKLCNRLFDKNYEIMSTENISNEEQGNGVLADVMAMLPTHGLHKTLGKIEILGVRVKSNYSNNLMYMTIIDGEMLWVYDYETELLFDKKKELSNYEYDKKLLMDYGVKIQEYLLKPPFNLEHAQHGIACDKLADVREDFLDERHTF